MEIPPNATILFQGDSITDAGRHRKREHELGSGYVMMAGAWFCAKYPELNVKILNRGVSGNTVRDLRSRWQKDCIELKPTVVSILIGINDTLGRFFWNQPTSAEDFERDYRAILEKTSHELNAKIVLMEPFLVSAAGENLDIRDDLSRKIEAVQRLASQFETLHVPLNDVFAEAVKKKPSKYWSTDGIHPTLYGHALIAQSWLETVTRKQC